MSYTKPCGKGIMILHHKAIKMVKSNPESTCNCFNIRKSEKRKTLLLDPCDFEAWKKKKRAKLQQIQSTHSKA